MSEFNTVRTIGMDLGDKQHVVHCLDVAGDSVFSCEVRNTRVQIEAFFTQLPSPCSVVVAMESGTHSPWISHLLSSMGFEVLVGNARKLRVIWQSDQKNDSHDAEMLARIARFDRRLLSPIQHRSMSAHADLSVMIPMVAATRGSHHE